MISFRDLPISRKLVRMNMIISASVLLFACAAFIGYELLTFRKSAVEHLATDAEIVGIDATAPLLFSDPDAAGATVNALRAIPEVIAAAIYRADGRLFARYVRSGATAVAALPATLSESHLSHRIEGDDLIVVRPIVSDGRRIGTVYIQSDLTGVERRLKSYSLIALGVLLACFAGALAVSRMLEKKISRPILGLARTTKEVAEQRDYSVRAVVPGRDEIGMLAESFNEMLGEIEAQNDTLRESERNFRELANAMPQIVWTVRANGRLEFVNDRWFTYTGMAHAAAVADESFAFIHPDDGQYRDSWSRALRTGTPFTAECRIRRADAAYRWHLTRALPVRGRDGRIVRWFGTSTDIDDQKRAEAEVREINARLAQILRDRNLLLESTGEGFFAVDDAGCCTMANRMAASLLARPPEMLPGNPIDALIHDHDSLAEMCAIERAFRSGESSRVVDEYFWRGDGTAFPVEYTASPLVDEGVVRGAVVTFSDVTERRALERRLEQIDRVSSLGRMAATIAHEFNNVLMGIQPFAEALQMTHGGDPKLRQAASHILNSVKRGKGITQDILRIARPAEPSFESVDVTGWIEHLAAEIRAVTGPVVCIEVRTPPAGTLFARCDPAQMQQVVSNLALNARDAMPRGGSITIRAEAHHDNVRLTISDTGSGIAPETLPFIFEPLFTTKQSGTGIGLAVAQQLVLRNGGAISVDSVPGLGTRFYIDLPRATAMTAGVVQQDLPSPLQFGVRRIVIVEDDPLVASGLVSILELQEVGVRVVDRGSEAVGAVSAFDPDVVLIDISLPDMSGTEVYRQIAAEWPELAVVFSTGHADEAHLPDPSLKHVGFLRKPYTTDMLLQTLREVMG